MGRTTRWMLMAACLIASPAWAQVAVTGPAGQAVTLTAAELAALPPGPAGQGPFTGPTLWSVLQRAGVVDADFHGHVRQVLTVTGQDGYTATIALGELDPEFEGKAALLATKRGGEALPIPRLVLPGDKRGGRAVHDVVRMDLK